MLKEISGFSKLNKSQKIDWLSGQFSGEAKDLIDSLSEYWHSDIDKQDVFDEFSENTVSNFYMPFGIAPNFLINNKMYCIPMVIEESSVVAAASKAAKFWLNKGGFKAEVLSMTKVGHIHFTWTGKKEDLNNIFILYKHKILAAVDPLAENMKKRGGGVLDLALQDCTDKLANYYKLEMKFDTCDAMGANFINTLLEETSKYWYNAIAENRLQEHLNIVMCILSNYTPECLVKCSVSCPADELGDFAQKFVTAVEIANVDVSRAVTHNKGIFNGIDAVILATGNDFRATSACGHAYASRKGQYKSLSTAKIEDGQFKFEITLPIALGTVGGLTKLHPLAKTSLSILGNPDAAELMKIVAATGLAQNFAAVKSLVTTGIQKGHMKMHLLNILKQLDANDSERELAKKYFSDKIVSFSAVRSFLLSTRIKQ
jgi:hydroxymethylglutaryl-CoA reductase